MVLVKSCMFQDLLRVKQMIKVEDVFISKVMQNAHKLEEEDYLVFQSSMSEEMLFHSNM